MKTAKDIERWFETVRCEMCAEMHQRTVDDALEAMGGAKSAESTSTGSRRWRIIMKSPIRRLAAAAVIIIAVLLSATLFRTGNRPRLRIVGAAYALEQAMEATTGIRTMHCRIYESTEGLRNNRSDLCWIRYNDAGVVSSLRWNQTEEDGMLNHIVWNEGVYYNWAPQRNVLHVYERSNLGMWEWFVREHDPKHILERLYNNPEENEAARLIIREPVRDGEPIYVEATHLEGNYRAVLLIDPETKLLKQYSTYDLDAPKDDQLGKRIEYLAYDQAIDESVFELDAIPDDARVLDYINQIIGLEQGDLTDHEIAAEVVRTVLEATIAGNHDEASKLLEGGPDRTIEEFTEATQGAARVTLISVGPPEPHKESSSVLCVPCKIEVENEKGTRWIDNITITARKIERSEDRWIVASENPGPTDSIMRETAVLGTIIPKVRVGDFTFDMSKDDILAKLGTPLGIGWKDEAFTLDNLPSKYYMSFAGGLFFLIADDSVRVIGVNKPFYKFANGLGVGDSERSIIKAFGEDFELHESKWKDMLFYEGERLKFKIHKGTRIVTSIDVIISDK